MNTQKNISVPGLSALEDKIGYKFRDESLVLTAMTHSSYSNELRSKGGIAECNERLEFLGDSVLSVIVSDYLFRTCPDMPEGDLSRIRSCTVCEKALGEFAHTINLGEHLLLGRGEELNNGRERISILADAFEALLASIYLDGGIDAASDFVLPFATADIGDVLKSGKTKDYKTLLQQIIQQEQGELLEYVLVREYGPAHRRHFDIEARLNSNVIGHGSGSTKREAEQLAAREALALFGAQ